ncbi:hypothetical protein KBX50_00530 [Micromonospora sp. C51]|uniref:hypothetical protein n=1 Tax=Micromonospora sp. C51 TaxID=2824879 RepID=UPI001B3898F9|nr:hypothetical protein [Micromonospora sp. C51]MBQ1046965.1 hypothetical protein [Micromonospora sp. C51]
MPQHRRWRPTPPAPAAGPTFDDGVAAREALRIYGEMMISHMQAAARHPRQPPNRAALPRQRC